MNMDAWARKSPNIHRFICLTLLLALCLGFHPDDASAFDDVSAIGTSRKGPIARIDPLKDGVVVHYADGANIRFKDNINPNRGSPVNYRYVAFDAALQAYVMDVWRVGKQTVLVSKSSGAFAEVGGTWLPSANQRHIFSTDCWEIGCYYQLTEWPSGKRLVFSQSPGKSNLNLAEAIDASTIRWSSESQIDFDMPCWMPGQSPHSEPVKLILQNGRWKLIPEAPCA